MEKFLLVVMLIAACRAAPQDLSGKVFTFPKETNTAYVKLMTSKTTFPAVTACLRFFTDLKRDYGLFSLATRAHINDFLLFTMQSQSVIRMHARDALADFQGHSLPVNTWHSLCGTWSSANGVAQLWVNGMPSSRRFTHSGQSISGTPMTILGQEQDTYGGGFDAQQSFVGMISDVHMWDQVLSPCEIRRYTNNLNFIPGNVFNWRALDFQIAGQVLVENKQDECKNLKG